MKKLLILSALSLSLFACSDDDRLETDVLNEGPKIVGFENTSESIAYFSDEGQIQHDLPVIIYGLGDGNANGSNIEITYEVDLVNSTATEGTEFEFGDATHKITIPSGGSFATIPLLVNTGSFSPTEKTELVLKLTTTTDGVIGEQVKTAVIAFVGCQSQLPTGSYSWASTAGFAGTATISQIATNTFQVPFPGVASGGQPIPMQFNDICGEFTHLGWAFSDTYLCSASNITWDSDLNTLTFEELRVYNGLSMADGVFFDRKTTVYTKL